MWRRFTLEHSGLISGSLLNEPQEVLGDDVPYTIFYDKELQHSVYITEKDTTELPETIRILMDQENKIQYTLFRYSYTTPGNYFAILEQGPFAWDYQCTNDVEELKNNGKTRVYYKGFTEVFKQDLERNLRKTTQQFLNCTESHKFLVITGTLYYNDGGEEEADLRIISQFEKSPYIPYSSSYPSIQLPNVTTPYIAFSWVPKEHPALIQEIVVSLAISENSDMEKVWKEVSRAVYDLLMENYPF